MTNAMSEMVNSQIRRIRKRAWAFRGRERFREAIMFHMGRLDLYPTGVGSIHSNA